MTRMEYLEQIIKKEGYKDIAEIGLNACHTAAHLLETCDIKSYLGIDILENGTMHNLAESNKAFTFVQGDSGEVAGRYPDKSFDLVFIDGDHSYAKVIDDIKKWIGKVREGGILCGDDYGNPHWPDVERAVGDYFKNVVVDGEKTIPHVWSVRIKDA